MLWIMFVPLIHPSLSRIKTSLSFVADGLRVGAIVLVGFDVGLDELRRDQAHRVAKAL